MTSPTPASTPPGFLRGVQLGDVAGLLNDASHNHLGIPAGVAIDYPSDGIPHPRLQDPQGTLRAGDTYLFPLEELLSRAVDLPGGALGVVADFLQALGRTAAAGAVSAIGLMPLAWDVPQRAGPVTTPAPTPTRVKRPRLPPGPAHVRLTFSGIFGALTGIVEQWDWSVKTALPTTELDGPALVARADAMRSAYALRIAGAMMPHVILTECRYAMTGADGKVLRFPDGAYRQGINRVPLEGGSRNEGHMPLQSALVVSLGSSRPGATGRGRFYLPLQDPGLIQADYRVTAGYVTPLLNQVAAFVGLINAIGSPMVVNSSKGYNSNVTTVRIGLAPDTMRSRRESVAESYLVAPVAG